MANNNDMNISMKFTADVNRAKKNIQEVVEAINLEQQTISDLVKVEQTEAKTQESATKAAKEHQKEVGKLRQGLEQLGKTDTSNELNRVYEKQTDEMNRGQQAIIKLIEQEKAEERAQEAAAKAAKQHQKEVEKLRQGLDKLLASIDPATKGLSRLDELESKLRKSKKAGVIDGETFNDYLGKINNQRVALSTVETLNDGIKKLNLNSKAARRSFFMMSKQLAAGNFNGIGNSIFSIANMTGMLPPLFSAATLSVVGFIAAAYGIAKVLYRISAEQEAFKKSIISTGNYAGTTASNLEAMSQKIGSIGHNYSETRENIAQLTQQGQLSATSIENIGTAAAYMSALTGQSSKEAISSFNNIQKSVTEWAFETNKQYHWMDLATYKRIAALEAQGDTEEAIAVATGKYADVLKARAEEMKNQLNWLEKAWVNFKNGISDLGNSITTELKFSLGLATLDEEIKKIEQAKKRGFYIVPGADSIQYNENDDKLLQQKYAERDKLKKEADKEREQSVNAEKAILAQRQLDELHKKNTTDAERQSHAIEQLNKNYQALWADKTGRKDLEAQGVTSADGQSFSGGQYDKDVKSITDKGINEYNKGLEKSLKLTSELQRVMYEINEGKYKNASQAEKDKAIELAKQIDAKNAAKNKKSDFLLQNDKNNLALQQQLNELLLGTKASDETVEQWYNNLLTQFKKTGNKEGIDLIDQILPLKKAEANLNEITTKIQQAQSRQSTKEQSIQAQVTGGLITQVEAQSQLVELHKQTAQELENYLPALQAMTELPGQAGENAQKALATLQLQIAELNKTTDALTNAFQNGLQTGIQSSLDSLAKGTFELKDALLNLAQSILSSMAQVASKSLADMAMNGLSNLGNSLFGTATDAAVDNANAAAAAGLMETAIATSTATGAGLIGESISMSAGIGSETISASMVTAGTAAGEIISAAMIAAASANAGSSAFGAAAVAAATGGYISGPGSSTSDSIPARLSNGEFVVNAASVKKYGVDYLHAINTGRAHHYASGGLVSNVSSPKAPNIYDENSTSRTANQSQSAPVIQQTLVLDSGEMMKSGISSVTGSRSLLTWIRANAATLKQELS
ncbi:phage tail length tape measure family protein [Gilliamella apicola]|uniref:phage tail length tape measure family protein n=1 Tax=Gilliamella apicola TaxID=1196095 RepID=UPI0039863DF1